MLYIFCASSVFYVGHTAFCFWLVAVVVVVFLPSDTCSSSSYSWFGWLDLIAAQCIVGIVALRITLFFPAFYLSLFLLLQPPSWNYVRRLARNSNHYDYELNCTRRHLYAATDSKFYVYVYQHGRLMSLKDFAVGQCHFISSCVWAQRWWYSTHRDTASISVSHSVWLNYVYWIDAHHIKIVHNTAAFSGHLAQCRVTCMNVFNALLWSFLGATSVTYTCLSYTSAKNLFPIRDIRSIYWRPNEVFALLSSICRNYLVQLITFAACLEIDCYMPILHIAYIHNDCSQYHFQLNLSFLWFESIRAVSELYLFASQAPPKSARQ